MGSLSLFCFQQSIYASVFAFLKRFTSDLRQTLFFEVSKSLKPLKYKAFRAFGIIPTRQMEVRSKQSRLGDVISFGFI